MKVVVLDTYRVTIALGSDPGNALWSVTFIGEPTVEKVKASLECSTRMMHKRVMLTTGLPDKLCAIHQQCLYLVDLYGLPPNGLGKKCTTDNCVIGHISIDRAESVTQVI